MDKFKIQYQIEAPKKDDPPTLEEDRERRKFFECAQFDCLPRHLGLAVAMKNYWVYHYDIISAS